MIVTSVGSAMERMLPAITPSMTMRMNAQSQTLATSRKRRLGDREDDHRAPTA